MKKRNLGLLLLLIFLSLFSFLQIDYSNLSRINWHEIFNILKALSQPDWTFVYDGTSEDLISLMFETFLIAFYGSLIGSVLALPLSILGSKRILGPRLAWLALIFRGLFGFLRSVPALIYGILFVRMVGPGPFAGSLALAGQLLGMLAKLVGESFDSINQDIVDATKSTGASSFQVFQYGIIPQVVPIVTTYILNHFEINLRSATILGLVGAGGIGAPIIFALQQRDWPKVSIILLAIILIVLMVDKINGKLRKKLQ